MMHKKRMIYDKEVMDMDEVKGNDKSLREFCNNNKIWTIGIVLLMVFMFSWVVIDSFYVQPIKNDAYHDRWNIFKEMPLWDAREMMEKRIYFSIIENPVNVPIVFLIGIFLFAPFRRNLI